MLRLYTHTYKLKKTETLKKPTLCIHTHIDTSQLLRSFFYCKIIVIALLFSFFSFFSSSFLFLSFTVKNILP